MFFELLRNAVSILLGGVDKHVPGDDDDDQVGRSAMGRCNRQRGGASSQAMAKRASDRSPISSLSILTSLTCKWL